MVEISQVTNKSMMKQFCDFPLRLYKRNPYYCPPFYSDELKLFDPKKKGIYADYTDSVFFLAYSDGSVVGRIGVIINHAYNIKARELSARFTRFDCIDDFDVAEALFAAAEKYVRANHLNRVYGPMGFTDLDREGLLVEGFDCCSCYGSSYNFPYYAGFIEKLGYKKSVDWIERRVKVPAEVDPRVLKFSQIVSERYKLKDIVNNKDSIGKVIKKYGKAIFALLNNAYKDLHGTVPITDRVRDATIKQLRLILNPRYISLVVNENDELVGFGIGFPGIWKALNKTKGKLFPFGFITILRAIKKHEEIESALIAVRPDYQSKGVTAVVMVRLFQNIIDDNFKFLESNATLEDNHAINNLWENYEHTKHKRKRCYVKDLT